MEAGRQRLASIDGAGAHDGDAGTRGVGVVEPRQASPAMPMGGDAPLKRRQRHLDDFARDLERGTATGIWCANEEPVPRWQIVQWHA
jgi:hypothetical protein